MYRNLEFKRSLPQFQRKLAEDAMKIKRSPNLFVLADKTTNIYSVKPDRYNKLLSENVSSTYKKVSQTNVNVINREAKTIANKLEVADRIEVMAQTPAYITLKDHKDRFLQNPKCRLINPAKSEIGSISKIILDKINDKVRKSRKLNQWKNTSEVINWFKNLTEKPNSKFVKFDIVEFYPSITSELLSKAMQFARLYVNISEDDTNIIMHCRKCVLFGNNDVWCKKQQESFDVTMGSFDGAEICELVGLFLLSELEQKLTNATTGLYRDDGLACLPSTSSPTADRARKDIEKIFQSHNLRVTVEANLVLTEFLDVYLDLKNSTYYPYRKPNNDPLYINVQSNHPPSIIKGLPAMISQRISQNSSSEHLFNKAWPDYEKALQASGFFAKSSYSETNTEKAKNRPRKIIWFNPPFNKNVKTNVGKHFMHLLEKHFPKHHKYAKLFNKNNVKISYSCMPNMSQVISRHNKTILSQNHNPPTEPPKMCNCRAGSICPLSNQCLERCLVYQATVKTSVATKIYIGCTEATFKTRYANHVKSFKHRSYSKETELSKYIWKLIDQNEQFEVAWKIITKTSPYTSGTRKCDLCITEKMHIASADPTTLLNTRAEIVSKCRHRNKFLLKNVK